MTAAAAGSLWTSCIKIQSVLPDCHKVNSIMMLLWKLYHQCPAIVLLEDDTVANGGQQIVEVELAFVVARFFAMLLPKVH